MGPPAGDKELGVLALGVQGVGGDDAPGQSSGSSSGANRVISLVLPSTRTWPSTTPQRWSRAASRCTGWPSALA
ncbi:hypothetical protein [Planotetraspora phitsanulokensis]|nr:hypothetical protein [Planotetraspora phitsanulokensis]